MIKRRERIAFIILALACACVMTASIVVGCLKPNHEMPSISNVAATVAGDSDAAKSNVKDEEGNLLVPFDLAYPEAFATGDYEYKTDALLLKMSSQTSGSVSKNLKKYGVQSLEAVNAASDGGTWFRAQLENDNAKSVIKNVRKLKEVFMADFDYIYRAEAVEEAAAVADENRISSDVLDNPYASEQWYLNSSGIQDSWDFLKQNGMSAGGDSSVVVAVIDTGVDYVHPDLINNMWLNTREIPNNGKDDDGNGYVDDYYGYDAVANDGDPADDHGHGTHVAGIIAAANNKEGIVGVAYNVKIMAVKAGQASGVFTQSDIAKAILYAYENGADVINMSFGGSACSIAVQDALTTAYTRSILVASAGNDGMPNEGTDHYPALPNYPAALSYVLGVMSIDRSNTESGFTNWDATAFNTVEYEMYAPGEAIMSTLPGERYGKLSGTSMAAPIVSGAAALLRSYYKDRDAYPSKFIMAQLAATSEDRVACFNPEKHAVNGMPHNLPMRLNVYDAFTKLPKPDISLHNYYLFDSALLDRSNSEDGVVDAGETIAIGAVLRNRWGMSANTVVRIDAKSEAGMANTYVDIKTGTADFGEVGTYSTKDTLTRTDAGVINGIKDPLIVRVSKDCPNDYLIRLNVTITYTNGLDAKDEETYESYGTIEFIVRSGTVLPRQIKEDMTLTKDNLYLIPNSTYIAEGVTVTVQPGTRIQFWSDDPQDPYADTYIAYLAVAGKFITEGTEDEPVEMFPSEFMSKYRVEIVEKDLGVVKLNYTTVTNPYLNITFADHCTFNQNYVGEYNYRFLSEGRVVTSDGHGQIDACKVTNSVFYKLGGSRYTSTNRIYLYGQYQNCIFTDCALNMNPGSTYLSVYYENCVFMGNNIVNNNNGYVSNSSLGLRALDDLRVNSHYYNSQTNTTYLTVLSPDNAAEELPFYRSLAQYMGGDIACIETEEEWQYFQSKRFFGFIGLEKGSDTWLNGAPVGEFINPKKSNAKYRYAFMRYDEIVFDFDHTYILLEFPGEINEEEFHVYQEAWRQETVGDPRFVGNAILNDFNDTNIEHWLRVTANAGGPDDIIHLSGNYWGTTDKEMVERQIVDFDDFQTLQDIVVGGYLSEAPSNVWPFVTDAYLLNSKGERVRTVTNETVTFVVKFNRAMDTSVPLRVRFGSSEPYAEYEVEGKWQSSTEWRGTYTLKTTIENGNQFLRIENGRAAGDKFLALYEHAGRFGFEIDTSAAQALIMRGEANENGIQLYWEQDDFETLAGYNVYRSTKEDGYYERLNKYVIPAETKEFFDDTVEPGVLYYYNFTVVQTDFNESTPSGKIVIRSLDTMAPDIYHSPVRTAFTGSNLVVSALVTDNLQIVSAKLYYRTTGSTAWKKTEMTASNSRYSGVIPASDITTAGLEYYISVSDGINVTEMGSAANPYEVTVKLAVDKNSLGDVDGDGVITAKDALLLLQHANDLINLSAEEFARADIDGDGVLTASEALIILQYVSGKRTTITA